MNNKKILGNNLRSIRLQMGLTQKAVAQQMNMVREQYVKYERGIIELDYDKIMLVCKILKVTPNDIFYGCE